MQYGGLIIHIYLNNAMKFYLRVSRHSSKLNKIACSITKSGSFIVPLA